MVLDDHLIIDVMERNPLTLLADMSVAEALAQFEQANVQGAPVVDADKRLLGFFSVHDLLVNLWRLDYAKQQQAVSVASLMTTEVHTVRGSDSVLQLAEYMSIDHDQLYPVNSSGMMLNMSDADLEQRIRNMKVSRPKQYPVVADGIVIGLVNRGHIANLMQGLCYRGSAEQEATDANQVA
ncbi:CBS domain-containing protein [Ferrimonas lipolytica]|uniref:CBS domain-containing protein n=1 Tax=Ferrimonas lipolytica TaxID=2724191 RepID=A0A6H1UI37_9GAMM|nr:CBS domain-containing protein [Ferrimonas lipolytica]QIZ78270.1 CBS domain-containing protein [Ferrimonas lipolytica]